MTIHLLSGDAWRVWWTLCGQPWDLTLDKLLTAPWDVFDYLVQTRQFNSEIHADVVDDKKHQGAELRALLYRQVKIAGVCAMTPYRVSLGWWPTRGIFEVFDEGVPGDPCVSKTPSLAEARYHLWRHLRHTCVPVPVEVGARVREE